MRKRHSLFLLALFACPQLLGGDAAPRRTEGPVTIQTDKIRIRLSGAVDFVMFSDSGQSITGLVAAGDLQYAFSRGWGMGAGVRQAFSSSGFSAFFTEIHLCLTKTLTGSLLTTREQVSVSGVPVSYTSGPYPTGWMSRFYVSEYFINTTGAVLPYTGLGVGFSYDWNFGDQTPVSVGIRADRISNGTKAYFPIAAFATIGLWI